MPACPTRGPAALPCSSEVEADPPCTASGDSGAMADLGPGKIGPGTPRVTHRFECPECGHQIGVTADDRARTVARPGCSCFLGTPLAMSDH